MTWQSAKSSGVRLSNLTIDSNQLSVDVAWDYAWNTPTSAPGNNDAVWLFAKYKNDQGVWIHLNLTPFYQVLSSNQIFDVSTNVQGAGVIITPSQSIAGVSVSDKVVVTFNDALPSNANEVVVQAIEMVWIPEAAFYVGDGTSKNHLYKAPNHAPFLVENEQRITVDSVSGLWADEIGLTNDIPSDFPKGYMGFYAMKYEVSQNQYVAFLNTLDLSQQTSRVKNNPAGEQKFAFYDGNVVFNRNGISVSIMGNSSLNSSAHYGVDGNNNGVFNELNDGGDRACNFLNFEDVATYLDWAGLRPFTEFEYEKMCRGQLEPIPQEFAWGTPYVKDANTIVSDGLDSETVSETGNDSVGLASHGYAGPKGGLRSGFAANATSSRVEAGASYYGVMELSGNLWEYAIKAYDQGLLFDATNGDGELSVSGTFNQSSWDVNAAAHRGGAWNSGIFGLFRDLAVSDRFYIDLTTENRRNTAGGRGVLTW